MIRRFFAKLFPPTLVSYIPGAKLLAGVFTALGLLGLKALTDANIDTSVIGIPLNEGTIAVVASLLAVYMWPTEGEDDIPPELVQSNDFDPVEDVPRNGLDRQVGGVAEEGSQFPNIK